MDNQILHAQETLVTTSTTIVLSYAPGNTYPPKFLVVNAGAAATVTLPKIGTSLSGGLWTQGCGDGFEINIKTLTTNGVTVSAASGDSIEDAPTMTADNESASLVANLSGAKWYRSNNAT